MQPREAGVGATRPPPTPLLHSPPGSSVCTRTLRHSSCRCVYVPPETKNLKDNVSFIFKK